ncbi:MAG: hypothetical protein IT318_11190 [Anaerolineales bacterium]|nr:hypothetical protein [Anaerolineales bacterium]
MPPSNVALQVRLRRLHLPDLGYDPGLRVDSPPALAELLLEAEGINLLGHVQPRAVDAQPQPARGYLH